MTESVRNQPLVGSPLFGGYATRYQTYSDRAALAAWLRIHAGQNRMLWEHATGDVLTDPTSNEVIPPCAPRNPMGELGECHCGAPFGKALVHTFYAWACQPMDSAPQISGVDQFEVPPFLWKGITAVDTTFIGFDEYILVPVPAGSAYRTCSVDAAFFVHTTAAVANGSYLDVAPHGTNADNARSVVVDVQNAGYLSTTRIANFDLVPGEMNRILVRMRSGSALAMRVYLQALVFSQTT